MRQAVASRAPELTGWRLIRLYGNLAGNLFIRSYERGERIHAAMLSRGYDGVLPATGTLTASRADWLLVFTTLLVGGGGAALLMTGDPVTLTSRYDSTQTRLRLPGRDTSTRRHRPRDRDRVSESRCSAPTAPASPRSSCTSTGSSCLPTGTVEIDGTTLTEETVVDDPAATSASSSRTRTISSS